MELRGVAVEKLFSAVVEMQDGKTQTLSSKGQSVSSAFQQFKAMPGVRRVGKVTEISDNAPAHPGKHPHHAPKAHSSGEHARPDNRAIIRHVISGPRVVLHAPSKKSGEQPFRHLKAPPEQPKPVKVPHHEPPKREPEPQPVAESSAEPAPREYRITKSRRTGGQPYLLQRGYYHQQKGKRVFTVEWEKGFPDREKAEKHEQWVKKNELEMAEVDQES